MARARRAQSSGTRASRSNRKPGAAPSNMSRISKKGEKSKMSRIHITYDSTQDAFIGAATVNTMLGAFPIFAIVPLRPIGKMVATELMRKEIRKTGANRDEVGFGF